MKKKITKNSVIKKVRRVDPFEKQFAEVSAMILKARTTAYKNVNSILVELYWNLGKYISGKIAASEWGERTVEKLSEYISAKIPDAQGFNRRSLYRMKQFYETYAECKFVSPLVTQIQWSNHLTILSQTKTIEEKIFYVKECSKCKYTKRELEYMISSCLFEQTITAAPKITKTLKKAYPKAETVFRDSYTLDFLGLPPVHFESDLRKVLLAH